MKKQEIPVIPVHELIGSDYKINELGIEHCVLIRLQGEDLPKNLEFLFDDRGDAKLEVEQAFRREVRWLQEKAQKNEEQARTLYKKGLFNDITSGLMRHCFDLAISDYEQLALLKDEDGGQQFKEKLKECQKLLQECKPQKGL